MKYSPYEIFVQEYWTNRRTDEHYITPGPQGEAIDLLKEREHKLRSKFIMATGLAGETGEVVELLKKEVRDNRLDETDLSLELGDVLYYLTKIANDHGYTLEQLQKRNVHKLKMRRQLGKKAAKKMFEQCSEEYWRIIDGSQNEGQAEDVGQAEERVRGVRLPKCGEL